jgi:hypothetical protein
VASVDFGVRRFIDDSGFLSDVVRFDLPLLGDVAGLRGVPTSAMGTGSRPGRRVPTRLTRLR